jgi:hypothetical protein
LGLANLIQDDDLVRRTTWMNAFLFFISIFNPIIFFLVSFLSSHFLDILINLILLIHVKLMTHFYARCY